MKSFKFRLWDKALKRFIFTSGWNYVMDFNGKTYTTNYKGNNLDIFNIADSVEVTQFTGLLDFEGKEIFDGDILEIKGTGRYLVEFCNGAFTVECLETKALEMFMFDRHLLIDGADGDGRNNYVAVVGNKFENPELLEMK